MLIVVGVVISALELVVPGLIVLPFGLGAIVGGIAGLLGVNPLVQVAIFVVASLGFFLALRPLARRLNASSHEGIGSSRLIGSEGVVLEDIAEGETGIVRIEREEWRAESVTGSALSAGTRIRVLEVRGTRVVVETVDSSNAPLTERPPLQ